MLALLPLILAKQPLSHRQPNPTKQNTQNALKATNLCSPPLLDLQFTHPLRWQKGVCPVIPQLKDHCTVEPNSLRQQLLHPWAAHCWISDDLKHDAQTKRSLLQTTQNQWDKDISLSVALYIKLYYQVIVLFSHSNKSISLPVIQQL